MQPVTIFLLLRVFASGSTALTEIVAISNGIPTFRPPEANNAGRTLIIMVLLMGGLFIGSLGLTQHLVVVADPDETILSALARRILGNNMFYYLVQANTLLILTIAANTSFSGFPHVASILARDGYLPRQLTNLGDRLVYANGMDLHASSTALLIVIFGGVSHALVPLFTLGAFLAFTLSQTGMVIHWYRLRSQYWQLRSVMNGLGVLSTGIKVITVRVSKFTSGAWVTIIIIPMLIFIFYSIKDHYNEITNELTLRGLPPSLRPVPRMRLVIPISGVHRAVVVAVNYACGLSDRITAVSIEIDPGSG